MILFTNNQGEIKDVGTTKDESLIRHEISDDNNPFEGWSVAKICCYKVQVQDGTVVMLTPYVDSCLIERIDMLGSQTEAITPYTAEKTAYIGDTSLTFMTDKPGNLTVYGLEEYHADRLTDRIILTFPERQEVTKVTISIL